MEIQPDNPAARLYNILSSLKEASAGSDHYMINLWTIVLKTDETTELFVRLGKVYSMPGEIAAAMPRTIGYHPADINRWWGPLSDFFAQAHMKALWSSVEPLLAGNLLLDIDSCSSKLSAFLPEPQVEESQLVDLKIELHNLLEYVTSSDDISDTTKKRLIDRIQRIQNAVDNIWIDGAERLATELRATVEVVITSPEVHNDQPPITMRRVGTFVNMFLTTLNIWNGLNTAFPALSEVFQWHGPPAIEAPLNPELSDEETRPHSNELEGEEIDPDSNTDLDVRTS